MRPAGTPAPSPSGADRPWPFSPASKAIPSTRATPAAAVPAPMVTYPSPGRVCFSMARTDVLPTAARARSPSRLGTWAPARSRQVVPGSDSTSTRRTGGRPWCTLGDAAPQLAVRDQATVRPCPVGLAAALRPAVHYPAHDGGRRCDPGTARFGTSSACPEAWRDRLLSPSCIRHRSYHRDRSAGIPSRGAKYPRTDREAAGSRRRSH